eukprot:scaffold147026_cov30-Tisochrysis_lutea.AAC.2
MRSAAALRASTVAVRGTACVGSRARGPATLLAHMLAQKTGCCTPRDKIVPGGQGAAYMPA